jgi:hypothetical protein
MLVNTYKIMGPRPNLGSDRIMLLQVVLYRGRTVICFCLIQVDTDDPMIPKLHRCLNSRGLIWPEYFRRIACIFGFSWVTSVEGEGTPCPALQAHCQKFSHF